MTGHQSGPSPAARQAQWGGAFESRGGPVADFLGSSGRVSRTSWGAGAGYRTVPFDHRGRLPAEGCHAVQWLRPGTTRPCPQPVPESLLLLSGPLPQRPSPNLVRSVVLALAAGDDAVLAQLPAELTGCVLTPQRLVIFRGLSAPDQIFFRRTPTHVTWSADPRDLFDGRLPEFDKETLWRSCRGEDVFVYPELGQLHPGQAVGFDARSTRKEWYDQATPWVLPRRTGLREYADITYELLLEETRSYANSRRRVGILLSGGFGDRARGPRRPRRRCGRLPHGHRRSVSRRAFLCPPGLPAPFGASGNHPLEGRRGLLLPRVGLSASFQPRMVPRPRTRRGPYRCGRRTASSVRPGRGYAFRPAAVRPARHCRGGCAAAREVADASGAARHPLGTEPHSAQCQTGIFPVRGSAGMRRGGTRQ